MNKLRLLLTERRLTYFFVLLAAVILLILPGFEDRLVRAAFSIPLCVFAALFSISYYVRSNWRESQVGRSLLYWTTTTSVLSLYISIALLTKGDYLFANEIGTVIYAVLAATVYLMYRQWYKINKGEVIPGSSNDPSRPHPNMSCNEHEDCDDQDAD